MTAFSQRIVSLRTILFAICIGGLWQASTFVVSGQPKVTVDVAAIDRVRILNTAEHY